MAEKGAEPPFEGGSQRVPERRAEVPGTGRSFGLYLVLGIIVLVALAAVLWIIVPLSG